MTDKTGTTSGKSSCLMSFPFLLFLWPVSHLPLAKQTSAVEARQTAQHRARVMPRGQQTFQGKISTGHQNIDTASSFTRSALKLPETTRARPPPEPPPPKDRIAEPDPDIKTKTEPRTSAASPLLTTPTLPRTPPTLTTPGWHPVQKPPVPCNPTSQYPTAWDPDASSTGPSKQPTDVDT